MAEETYDAEDWRPVHYPAFAPYYEVSSLGRVRSLDRVVNDKGNPSRRKGRVLSPGRGRYLCVNLKADGRSKGAKVHALVAFAFLGDPPGPYGRGKGRYTVNHKNGDRYDNRPENLEWTTTAENNAHALRTGLVDVTGSLSPLAKLDEETVLSLRQRWARDGTPHKRSGLNMSTFAREAGVSPDNMRRVLSGRTWKHVGGPLYQVAIRRV